MTNFLYGMATGCIVTLICGIPAVHVYLTGKFEALKQHVSEEIKAKS